METALDRLSAALDDVQSEDVAGLPHTAQLDRVRELHRLCSRLDSALVDAVRVVHQQGSVESDGATSTKAWLKTGVRVSRNEASEIVETGRHLADLPMFAEAFADGRVTRAHVAVAAQLAKDVGTDLAPEAVEALLEPALSLNPPELKHVAKRIRELVGAEKPKPEPRDRTDRNLFVSTSYDGTVAVDGDLTPEVGAMFHTALNTVTPRPAPDDDRSPAERRHDGFGEILEWYLNNADLPHVGGERPHLSVLVSATDLQTPIPGRKPRLKTPLRFDGDDLLATLFVDPDDNTTPAVPAWIHDPGKGWADEAAIDWDAVLAVWAADSETDHPLPPAADNRDADTDSSMGADPFDAALLDAVLPEANTLVPARSALDSAVLVAGIRRNGMPQPGTGGVTEWGGQLSIDAVRRIACDAGINRIVLDQRDVPINAGRQVRLVRPTQRRILVARDGGCRFHGCDRPPASTTAHHATHWADGGPTDLNNLILLCSHHHHRIHDDGWRLDFDGHTVTIHRPDGTLLPPP